MILVYTGDGKGKTSACVGQAVRALGQGMKRFSKMLSSTTLAPSERHISAISWACMFRVVAPQDHVVTISCQRDGKSGAV